MVSLRCKMLVKEELTKLGLTYLVVELGMIETLESITQDQRDSLRASLIRSGLELMDDKKAVLIDKIKAIIIEIVHYSDEMPKVNFSAYLSDKLGYDYPYLANTFSEVNGITIEHFIITHKIERVKELLVYEGFTLTKISHLLNYSSVSHLSNQFKKITGFTPTFFKQIKNKRFKLPKKLIELGE